MMSKKGRTGIGREGERQVILIGNEWFFNPAGLDAFPQGTIHPPFAIGIISLRFVLNLSHQGSGNMPCTAIYIMIIGHECRAVRQW